MTIDTRLTVVMGGDEARRLTNEARGDAAALWTKLLHLYDGEAHTALGYASWGAYFEREFQQTGARGYQLLEAARVHAALSHSTIVERPANEAQARELAPLLARPDALREAWRDAQIGNERVTAADVREAVSRQLAPTIPAPVPAPLAVHYSSESPEWYTPPAIIERVLREFEHICDEVVSR